MHVCMCVCVYVCACIDLCLTLARGSPQPSTALLSVHALWGGGLVEMGKLSGILHYR